MGMPGPLELAILFGICILIFGTKRVRQMGGDLGGAIKGFRLGMKDADDALKELKED